VSWNWNGNQPSGTVGEVKAGEVTVTSHHGNEISKTGDESNPAVQIERSGNDVVKKASELNIEGKVPGSPDIEEKKEESATAQQNGAKEEKKEDTAEKVSNTKEKEDEAKTGEKRKADEKVDANEKETPAESGDVAKEDEQDSKKQKTANGAANGAAKESKKASWRPKSNGEKKIAPKKEKKVPAVGKSERKTRSQGAA
jgi:Hypervirulence associated proteins TUDOR domain